VGEDAVVEYSSSSEMLFNKVLRDAEQFDLIHVHSLDWMLPELRRKYPGKKIVMHHHGQNLREDKSNDTLSRTMLANLILYATPDLKQYLPHEAKYLPNPIDESLFKLSSYHGKGIIWPLCYERHIPYWRQVLEKFPDCVIWDRRMHPLPYWRMPGFWSSFEMEVSWKPETEYITGITNLTLSDLECLALGMKVFYWPSGEILTKFPEQHRTASVVKILRGFYEELV